MYDINSSEIVSSAPYRYNVHCMPINFPVSQYSDSISDSVKAGTLSPISDDFGTLQYVGGICVNNKIYCTPNSADNILVYDISDDRTYTIGSGLGTNQFKYTGQVFYKGKIYMLHRGTNYMIEVDPSDDSYRLINLGLGYTVNPHGDYMDSYHYNGIISDNGYLYQPPAYNNTDLLKINMEDFSVEKIAFTSSQVSTWIGCVKHPTENKIIFLSTNVFRVWDCNTDTYEDIIDDTSRSCHDMVYDPRHNCFYGCYPNHIFALMLDDYSCVDSGYINYQETGYGICLGLDGRAYHLEGNRAHYYTFNGTEWTEYNMTYVSTSENMGDDTPYIAGQAIDANGNIYGIPASGRMAKLSFTGIENHLPEWMVSSQYYGKY